MKYFRKVTTKYRLPEKRPVRTATLLSTHDSKFYTSRQFLFKIICTQIFSLNILLQGRGQTHFLTNMIKSVSLQDKD